MVWSPFKGQAGTTTALCTCAYYSARTSAANERTLMMRTKLKNTGIVEVMDAAKFGLSTSVRRRDYQMGFEEATGDRSIDRLLMAYAAGFQLMDTLEANVIPLDSKLYVLEGSRSNSRDIYEKEMSSTIEKILKVACFNFKNVFVEAEAGKNSVNSILFEAADRIIVCIPQNIFALRELQNLELPKEKMAYLVGNYDEDSILTAKNLALQLRSNVPLKGLKYLSSLKNSYSAGSLKRELEMILSNPQNEIAKSLEEVLG